MTAPLSKKTRGPVVKNSPKRLFLIIIMLCGTTACQPEQGIEAPLLLLYSSDESGTVVKPTNVDGLPIPVRDEQRPKAESGKERDEGKFDRFDVRGRYSDIFGTTPPPPRAVRSLGEFEETSGVLIAWNRGLARFMVDLIAASLEEADVWVITWDDGESTLVRNVLTQFGVDTTDLNFFEFPHESFWTRDFGPVTVVDEDGTPNFIDAQYYRQRRRDDAVPTLMGRFFNTDVYRPGVATEGGNFMSNGQGFCVVTNWLLQENPSLTPQELQDIQKNYYGCEETVVLQRLEGEGTGHVDMFAKFLSADLILVGEYDRFDPVNAAILDENVERLERFAAARGWPLEVVRMPMPYGAGGVYRSYTNSLMVNNRVLVPTYAGDRRYEDQALEIYRRVLPAGYEVRAIESEAVIQLGGAVHCTTMGFTTP